MATLETRRHIPQRVEVEDNRVTWCAAVGREVIERLPQIVWSDHTPWREANLWALEEVSVRKKNPKTVISAMTGIHAYAKWLEKEAVDWWDFPVKEADRCLVKYRGALTKARDEEDLAPSTAQQRMAVVVRFYRWLSANRLISPEWPMWRDRQVGIRISDSFGFERTLIMPSTDLAIPNRRPVGDGLEGGLSPVSTSNRNAILSFAVEHGSQELALMLRLGFRTGMRFGTIADLKVTTLLRAVSDPLFPGWFRLSIGPGARPPVHTKFSVSGHAWIEAGDLQSLKDYAFCSRRLKRQALANKEHHDSLFLTRYGGRYGSEGSDSSRAINVELGRLRRAGVAAGLNVFRTFHFHQTRCTFATELARVVIQNGDAKFAIEVVKEALLHQDESTTLKYIKFVQKSAVMAEASDAFTRSFLGLLGTARGS